MLFDNNGPNAANGTRPANGMYCYYAGGGGVGYGAGGGGGGLDTTNGMATLVRWPGGSGAPGFVYVEWG